jgi:hypothetical protein
MHLGQTMKQRLFEDYGGLCGKIAGEICTLLRIKPSLYMILQYQDTEGTGTKHDIRF